MNRRIALALSDAVGPAAWRTMMRPVRHLSSARPCPRRALIATTIASLLFLGMATYRLEEPGLYYDEVHQAVGAFAWVGRPTSMFSILPIASKPTFNMPYSGAIKTTMYGLYLRVSGHRFTIVGWRMVGILFTAIGIGIFLLLSSQQLSPPAQWLFVALILSDVNLLLQSRHDWGPVTLAFGLRMLFLGLWLRWFQSHMSPLRCALLGSVVGVAIFEKLSSVVLLGPLSVVVLSARGVGWPSRAAGAALGVGIGMAPVLIANLYWLTHEGTLLALISTTPPIQSVIDFSGSFLALGNGGVERRFMFTSAWIPWLEWVEGLSMAGLIVAAPVWAWRRGPRHQEARIAAIAIVSYAMIAIALRWLPAATTDNHWIIGTPFQYLGIAVTAASMLPLDQRRAPPSRTPVVFGALVVVMLAARMPVMAMTMEAIHHRRYTPSWHPSVNTGVQFAASRGDATAIVAADWGTATQVFCLANGRADFVFEPFWDYRGPESLSPILDGKREVVVALLRPRTNVRPEATERILADMAALDDWSEISLDASVQELPAIEIRVYRR